MAPIAIPSANGGSTTLLKATAPAFEPSASRFHASSSQSAMDIEAAHAAHNYHPLPIVFARALGACVWDPEGPLLR